ncbi:MAG: undecaprenyl/decaprenyl-phosphate alpha-N-acetylglucosaminyl 1-phosphate transferase [Bifidobacteriaceae bacterium]|jgi:UDP-GlcNAc:undecaprenyl-phosphate GlcNAc-1-phosphate transferase|nr:undecaprenyl/decaprenyl-phosphate alpha-N-acetylglucosaminyl 1-phosphate transferase [Bifidobacteriaceae bacterium]
MKLYLLIAALSALITFLMVPLVRRLAIRLGALTPVRDRDVHTKPIPRLGGLAMLVGVTGGLLVAWRVPFFKDHVFLPGDHGPWAVLGAGALVCLLGAADDLWDLDWLTKLTGQVLAAGLMAWQGVQLVTFPIGGLTISSARFSLMMTILVVVVATNAVNFVDGLDGLAAGLVAIGGGAFFVYTYLLSVESKAQTYASLAALILSVMVGAAVGFLPHNWHPAKIFMGDSGSYMLGLLFAAGTIAVTGQIDPAANPRQALPAFLPILLPLGVLALPLIDFGWSALRRLTQGHSPFRADRMHLHHRLLRLGHSHRRAVLIMYLWTAVVSISGAALVGLSGRRVAIGAGIGVVVALLLTLGPLRGTRNSQQVKPSQPADRTNHV